MFVVFVVGVVGGIVFDWFEVVWWSCKCCLWIMYCIIMYWGVGWVVLFVFGWYGFIYYLYLLWVVLLFGFVCGGVMYLFVDWLNLFGVLWIWWCYLLNLWNSGYCDLIVVVVVWGGMLWFV